MAHRSSIKEDGFSVIELLMAMVILVLVVAIGFLVYQGHKPKASKTVQTVTETLTTCPTRPNAWSAASSDIATKAALTYGKQAESTCLNIDNGSAMVNSALYASRFGNSAVNGTGAVVDITIKNITGSIQNYDLNHFAVQFPDGKIVNADSLYASTDSAGQLRPLTLAAGGSAEEVMMTAGTTSSALAGKGALVYTSPATHKITEAPITFSAPYN